MILMIQYVSLAATIFGFLFQLSHFYLTSFKTVYLKMIRFQIYIKLFIVVVPDS